MKIYMAAPLFTQAERIWNLQLAQSIEVAFPDASIILPQNECSQAILDGAVDFQMISDICLSGIDMADVVVAILDGADSDSGTCFECGYAYAKHLPIIGVRTDIRPGEDCGLNAMLNRNCTEIITFSGFNNDSLSLQNLALLIAQSLSANAPPTRGKNRC